MAVGEYEEPNYDNAAPLPDVVLYVMGAIDELRAIGIIDEVGGDEPLTNHEQRRAYRELKCNGYKPTLDEVNTVISKAVCADDQALFRRLFRGIIEDGWPRIHKLRAEQRTDEARNAEIRRTYGIGEGWIPL